MTEEMDLTPQNRRIICNQIGNEIGIDGEVLDSCLKVNTIEGLNGFRDAFLRCKRIEAVRQGFYSPQAPSDGNHPAEVSEAMSPGEKFAEWFYENGI